MIIRPYENQPECLWGDLYLLVINQFEFVMMYSNFPQSRGNEYEQSSRYSNRQKR